MITKNIDGELDNILGQYDLDVEYETIKANNGGLPEMQSKKEAIQSIKSLLREVELEARKDELKKTHDYIDDTYMIITTDLPSLLEQDRVFEIRKYHKAEIHKNLDERITELDNLLGSK